MDQTPDRLPHAAEIDRQVGELYKSEACGILRYAVALANNQEMAHDALQEAFFRFFIARSAGQDFQSPKAWLYRVVRNYVVDQKRSSSRKEVGIELALNVTDPVPVAAPGVTAAGLLQRAAQIGLSAREVECFRLRSEGLRYEDIAGVLGLQSGTVGALLARAHRKIRQALGKECGRNRDFTLPATPEKRYAH